MNELAEQLVAAQTAFSRAMAAAAPPVVEALAPVARMFADARFAVAVAKYTIVGPYDLKCKGDALRVLAAGIEWERPLSDAVRTGDSLPWMVYADWLDEHDEPHRASVARRVGQFYGRGQPTSAATFSAVTQSCPE